MANKTLNKQEVDSIAHDLFEAYKNHDALKMEKYSEPYDEKSAYHIQNELTHLKNEKFGGYKISLTSEETQKMFDSNEPLYGGQLDERFFKSGHQFNADLFMDPLVEVELVFEAKDDLSVKDTLEDLLIKTTVAPAIEVPDCRFQDWFPALPKHLVMSDAAVGGAIVYGTKQPTNQFTLDTLANVKCELFKDDKKLKEGFSSEVLGNPLNSLKWLVDKLGQSDKVIHKGEKVSTGTFLLPVELKKGEWKATFDQGFGEVHFSVK